MKVLSLRVWAAMAESVLKASPEWRVQIECEREELRRQVRLLNDILIKTPSFIFWKGADLRLQGCNENFARQVGLSSPQEIIGLTDHDLPWTAEQTEKFIQDDREILKTGKPKLQIEERQRQRDGQEHDLLTSKVPLYDGAQVVGVLGIYMDITALKTAQQELLLEKEKAEAANRLKSDFILNMQHDIRTPISGICGMLEWLSNQPDEPNLQSHLKATAQAAKELLQHCNDIVDFTRLDYGAHPILKQPFSLKALMQGILTLQRPAAAVKKLALHSQGIEEMPEILFGDAYRLERILVNVLSNAIKFTSQGHVSVHTRLEPHDNYDQKVVWCLTVEDTGVGMPADALNWIYETFTRGTLSNKGLYRGSGLGLRIVKQFVEELQGQIVVNSEINQGTTFRVMIPLVKSLIP